MLLAEGRNYTFDLDRGVVVCRVVSVKTLTMEEGAACALEKIAIFQSLAQRADVRGLIFDLRDAPKIVGPKTEQALDAMISAFRQAKKPLAILVADAVQELQQRRIAAAAMHTGVSIVTTDQALAEQHVSRT